MSNPYNYPNSYSYDPSLPIGYIKWDDESIYEDEPEEIPDENNPEDQFSTTKHIDL
jgi:hypothetical protein